MHKQKWIYVALCAIFLLAGYTAAMAAHPSVTVRDSAGNAITDGTTPYSPKQTCSGCHFYNGSARAFLSAQKRDCGAGSNELCATDYADGTNTVTKSQGYIDGNGKLAFTTFTATVPRHGVSTGKHSTQGRNDELTASQRAIWGAPGFITSPGMSGRY